MDDEEVIIKVQSAFDSNYDYGCNDYLLKSFCSNKCHLFNKRDEDLRIIPEKIYTIEEAHKRAGKSKLIFGYYSNLTPTYY